MILKELFKKGNYTIYSRERKETTRFYVLGKNGYIEVFFSIHPTGGLEIVYGKTYTETQVHSTKTCEEYHYLYDAIQIQEGQKIIPIECFKDENLDSNVFVNGIKTNDKVVYTNSIGLCQNVLDVLGIKQFYIKHDGKIALAEYCGITRYEPNDYVCKCYGAFKILYDIEMKKSA